MEDPQAQQWEAHIAQAEDQVSSIRSLSDALLAQLSRTSPQRVAGASDVLQRAGRALDELSRASAALEPLLERARASRPSSRVRQELVDASWAMEEAQCDASAEEVLEGPDAESKSATVCFPELGGLNSPAPVVFPPPAGSGFSTAIAYGSTLPGLTILHPCTAPGEGTLPLEQQPSCSVVVGVGSSLACCLELKRPAGMANGGYSSPFSDLIAVQRLAFVSRAEALGIVEGLRARRFSGRDEASWPSSSHPTLGRLSEVTSRMLPEICRLATAGADSAGAPEELVLVFLWLSLYRAFYRTRCRVSGQLLALDEGSGLLVPPLARAVPGTWQELLADAFDLERVKAYHLPYLSMKL